MIRRPRWRAIGAAIAMTAAGAAAAVGGPVTPAGAAPPNDLAVVDVPGGDPMKAGYYRLGTVSVSGTSAGFTATVGGTVGGVAEEFAVIVEPATGALSAPSWLQNTTTGAATAEQPRLAVFQAGEDTCGAGTGEVLIHDIAYGGGGDVTRLAMTWRLVCTAADFGPISSGYVYFNQPPGPLGSPTTGTYQPMTPKRLLDTRDTQPLGPGGTTIIQVAQGGAGNVPVGAIAAVVNITAIAPSADTFLTAFPTGGSAGVSNVNPKAGDIVPNLATVRLPVGGANAGKMTLYNDKGTTHAAVDVMGYFVAGDGGNRFNGQTPDRILDTRNGGGPVGPGGFREITVPGAKAAVLNVTATAPTAASFLTAYPADAARPNASNLNFRPGQTIPNLVVVKLDAGGKARIYNDQGNTHVIVDVVATFATTGATATSGRFVPVDPVRVYDSRNPSIIGLPDTPIGAGKARDLGVVGLGGGYPFEYEGMIANVTATNTSAASFLTVYPTGSGATDSSNLNWLAGEIRPNLVMTGTDDFGFVTAYNDKGQVDVLVDVAGWFTR